MHEWHDLRWRMLNTTSYWNEGSKVSCQILGSGYPVNIASGFKRDFDCCLSFIQSVPRCSIAVAATKVSISLLGYTVWEPYVLGHNSHVLLVLVLQRVDMSSERR